MEPADSIHDHFVAAREGVAGVEAERVLAQVNQRLFGIASEPVQLGRFVILRRLGAGGMGVVYLGYDRELDRSVALKLLRAQALGSEVSEHSATRLLREARALARVDHPNVIAIYEVGTDSDAVFLAMERVDGSTLSEWQHDEERPWQQIVELYLQAGRGLAAAHAAGVIHRDFKPENVLVSEDGEELGLRARVVDFGLARPLAPGSCSGDEASIDIHPDDSDSVLTRPQPDDDSSGLASNQRSDDLTRTGARIGTPAYMAPEQIQGRATDARTDQFSFAASIVEALTGQRAFEGDSVESLHAAVLAGRRRPCKGKLPGWLRRILARALEVDPDRRYPTMRALIAQIEAGLRAARRRWIIAGGVVVAVAAGLLGSAMVQPSVCRGGAEKIAAVWGQEQREQAEAAFVSTDKPFAEKAYAETRRRLDAYAQSWVQMHDETCVATAVRHEQSSAALDLRMACLERRRDEFQALVEVLIDEPKAAVVSRAVEASDALTPLAGCADIEALAAPEPLPDDPRIKHQVSSLRRQLNRGKALRDAGRYEDGLVIAVKVDADAQEISYGPLLAESALLLGTLRGLTGEAGIAGVDFDRSLSAALASGHMEVAMWAAIHAVHVVGFVGHDGSEGRRWAHLAAPLLTRVGTPPRANAALQANLGNIAVLQGELDEAEQQFKNAIEIATNSLGKNDVLIAKTLANLGAVYRRRGDPKKALESYDQAAAIFEVNFGPRHPIMATLANNTGVVHQTMGSLKEAEKHYQAVLSLAGSSISPTSPTLGHAHNNLGELLEQRGEHQQAGEHFLAAIDIWEQAHGPSHPLIAHPLLGLGRTRMALGKPQQAVAPLVRARQLRAGDDAGQKEVQVELDRVAKTSSDVLAEP